MTEPDLVGIAAPPASRRWFLKAGGSAIGLLLLPNLALAAVSKATRKPETAKSSAKAASGKSASPKLTKGSASKSARKTSSSASKSARSRSGSGKSKSSVARSSKSSSRSAKATRGRKGRGTAVAKNSAPPSAVVDEPVFDSAPAILSADADSLGARSLSLYNIHTGERADVDYFVDGQYETEALREIDSVLRDYHTDEVVPIDPELLNQLVAVRNSLGSRDTYRVFSGYRSPETNEQYRRSGYGVAEHSFHIKGRAIDVALDGRELRHVRNVALAMGAGGVGYYPWAGFVHFDSGPVRRW